MSTRTRLNITSYAHASHIILPSTPRSSDWYPPGFPTKILCAPLLLASMRATRRAHPFLNLIARITPG